MVRTQGSVIGLKRSFDPSLLGVKAFGMRTRHSSLTRMVTLSVAVQPFMSVTAKVYVMLSNGLASGVRQDTQLNALAGDQTKSNVPVPFTFASSKTDAPTRIVVSMGKVRFKGG